MKKPRKSKADREREDRRRDEASAITSSLAPVPPPQTIVDASGVYVRLPVGAAPFVGLLQQAAALFAASTDFAKNLESVAKPRRRRARGRRR